MLAASLGDVLPEDASRACLIGRAWCPGPLAGPRLVVVRNDALVDISSTAATMSALLALPNPLGAVQRASGEPLGALADWLAETCRHGASPSHRHLMAPNDLQVVKAAGVTFVTSMIERVIEEMTRGDARGADAARRVVQAAVGDNLTRLRPGSLEALRLKQILIARNMWSQYLEVGIGPDAEIFTKAPPMASVGTGVRVGLHPASQWNNPEPEVVLAVGSNAQVLGAALGNDVNLRDFEGRSALLLGKAKDNNASCAIGPFIRLFDNHFGLGDVRLTEVKLKVEGVDGYVLQGSSSMQQISRDPLELVEHAMGNHHQYPDGAMLFCGTMFAPIEDRDVPGGGFTHHLGDRVMVSSSQLGALVNWVDHCDKVPLWTFGIGALMNNLAARGLLPSRAGLSQQGREALQRREAVSNQKTGD